MRDSFVFYRSFFEAIQCLTEEERNKATWFIVNYALNEIEPEEKTGTAYAIFLMAKPQIDANNHRFENGKKGGAPKGNQNARKQPKNNQKQPNVNVNENVNVNVYKKAKNRFNAYPQNVVDYNAFIEELDEKKEGEG